MSDLRQLSFARNDKTCGVSDGITWEIKPLNGSVGVISFSDSKNIRILDNTNGNVPVNPIPADKKHLCLQLDRRLYRIFEYAHYPNTASASNHGNLCCRIVAKRENRK